MKFKKTKAVALALAAAVAGGCLSGCALQTTDLKQDLNRVVLEVDVSKSEEFATGGKYAQYADAISKSEVRKRELVAGYVSYGSTYVNNYGYSPENAYKLILSSLVNRAIYLQYAKVYFFEHDEAYTPAAYKTYVELAKAEDKAVAEYSYFLTADEIDKAEYTLKTTFNDALDSQETSIIDAEEEEHDHEDARTTPTGVDEENEDYFDNAYQIYTGANSPSACGSYETVEGSTPSTRREAYKTFLSNLSYYGLVTAGENTSDVASLSYYELERRSQYETAIIDKLTEAFEEEAAATVTEDWIKDRMAATVASQKEQFSASDPTDLESALDSVSDTSFVFYAPEGYGFVINILLPFSSLQTQELDDSPADLGDKQGNKFVKRASLLEKLTATDQRKTWFTGDEDYSFEEKDATKAYLGAEGSGRGYLFFENGLSDEENARYNRIPNYYGRYSYNGTVKKSDDGTQVDFSPNKISIDGFLSEMKNYLDFAGLSFVEETTAPADYYTRAASAYYNEDGTVDYSKFLYYKGKVDIASFDLGKIFDPSSNENKAFSVINELSFAYNTDTAGLNGYLGYAVSPNSTDFVKEFEYAAQEAVRGGPGTVTVAPSDYGWHIMYCTFAYPASGDAYTFSWDDIEKEGTFSNLYYEAVKATNFEAYSTDLRTRIINRYDNETCVTDYVERYSDLWAL